MTDYLDVLFLAVGYAVGWFARRHRRPSATAEPARIRKSHVATAVGPKRFRVLRGDTLVYSGSCGATARKHVELERANGETGEFYDNDVRRDWWPR